LGGNGVKNYKSPQGTPSRAKGAKDLLRKINEITPDSRVIWMGPPPSAIDNISYEVSSQKIKDRYDRRQALSEALRDEISTLVTAYIDPFAVFNTKGYNCVGWCDGYHMFGTFAHLLLDASGLFRGE